MNKKIVLSIWAIACFVWSGTLTAQDAFDQQLSSINNERPQEKKSKVEKLDRAPAFSLKDLNGNEVSLVDLKGKVVVLDFWATWCAPCVKSFPAMQMAVDQYKEDPGVTFLFINTWERHNNPTEFVQTFMNKKGFDFTVLVDEKDPVSKRNPVVERYGVTGIPFKLIIDPEGNIRHKIVGFMPGDNQAQVQELATLIESSRN